MIQIDHIINNVDGLHARPIAELADIAKKLGTQIFICLLYTSPSPRDS
mgnify:CR=1 FL=1